ncbi:hypothetical protein [Planococcus salinus]|uniref:Uncharacterized protein n=1 Tax=Planococcus salinus TaxID=1848460 RepID=A0A3M8P9V1_9BACL|nr:hypothetical protein [Planococcus salinus]RNF40457.1 hypothetical protein EEX84_03255 [Planococcus salinus]
MRTKLGTALDIFILLIGPWIIYTRILDISANGVSVYPVISIAIVALAVVFSIYNLYQLYADKQRKNQR